MDEWRYGSTILDLGTRIEVRGYLHVLAALSLGKSASVPIV
jgi:hypothetical protein